MIHNYWLEILFVGSQLPDGEGLYVCVSVGHRHKGPYEMQFRSITESNRVIGIGVLMCGYELILSMSAFPT
ncbi:MAG: hypothetical protein ACKVHE_34625 [Planctomycetales bacterium]